MAQQRWSESAGHIAGRLRRVGLVGSLLFAMTGCENEKDPFAPEPRIGIATTGSTSTLVGTWEATVLSGTGGNVQTFTTTWEFRSSRTCVRTQSTLSPVDESPLTEIRTCLWLDAVGEVVITWDDTGGVDVLQYGFAPFDTDRLVLDGIEYQRIE